MPARRFSGPLLPNTRSVKTIRRARVGRAAAPSNFVAGTSALTGAALNRSVQNPAVASALAAPPKKAKTKTGRNQKAIVTLAKQVRRLQLQRYGFVQSQYQYSVNAPLQNFVPALNKSTLFMVNNFYLNTPIYYGGIDGSQQSTFTIGGVFTKPTTDPDLDSRWLFNLRNQEDTVSKIQYLPEKSRINVKWQADGLTEQMPSITLRISVFRFKKMPPQTTARNYMLPAALGAYGHMCDLYNPANRERFNYRLHKVMIDKYVTIKPSALHTKYNRNISLDVDLPLKQLRPDITTDPSGQTMWTNTDVESQVFCLISSSYDPDNPVFQGSRQTLDITRFNVWRDGHGIATI